jgi:glycosyltransferase involved in cell wall biosynthesis
VRVVFLTHNYPRHAGDLPGAFLHPLATALRDRGLDVRVVAPADRGLGGRAALDGVPVRRVRYADPGRETIGYEGRARNSLRTAAGWVALRGLVRALRAGARAEAAGAPAGVVVHAHWWFPAGFAAPPELPAVITLHGTDARLLERGWLGPWLGRRVLRRAAVVTTVSESLARTVAQVTGRADLLSRVQPMPVPADRLTWSSGAGPALVVARLTAQKRVHLAIEAMARVAGAGGAGALEIIGDGPERPALEALAGSHAPGLAVTFRGVLPPEEVARALGAASVLLFPAVGEGFGLAAIEALMSGVPVVVCADGGGVVQAVEAHGGGVVAGPAPEDLAAGIRSALGAGVRQAARRAGERWRTDLEPGRVAGRFEAWYREALGG